MPNEPVRLFDATQEDIPDLISLFQESEAFHRQNRPDIFSRPTDGDLLELYEKYLRDPSEKTILAKVGNSSVGFLRYRVFDAPRIPLLVDIGRRIAMIEELVVSADSRRRGIGKALIAEGETRIRGEGVRHIQLNVFAFNASAQALYRSLGYDAMYLRFGKTFESST